MKKYIILSLGCLLLLGCKQEILEPEQMIQGRFALDDGSGLTSEYIDFNNGHLTVYTSTTYPLAEGKIWHTDGKTFKDTRASYTIQDGNLQTSAPSLSGPVELKDGILTIRNKKYTAMTGFEVNPYSKIIVERENTFPYTEQDISIPCSIERPIPAGQATVSSNSAWITNPQVGDGVITGHLSGTNTDRTGSITISYTHADAVTIQVRQAPSTFIRPASESLTLDYVASTPALDYTIENPVSTSVLTASASATWISDIRVSGTQVTFKVSENNTGVNRSTTLLLKYAGARDVTVSVTQKWAASSITMTPSNQTVDYTGGSFNFNYAVANPRANTSVTAASQDNWITDVKLDGTNVSYKVSENNTGAQRTGKIKLTYGSYATAEFSVKQAWTASSITMTPPNQMMNYAGGSFSFNYSVTNPRANTSVTAASQDSWITNVSLSGTSVSYKVSENNSGAQRTGKIKLTYGTYATAEFTVTQTWTASAITMTPSNQTMDYTGGSYNFSYAVTNPRANTSVTAASQDSWITNVSLSGTSVSYKVSENNSGAQRTGKIKLSYGSYATAEYTVTQSWAVSSITMTPSSQTPSYTGGSFSFSYEVTNPRANTSVTAASQVNWITDVIFSGKNISYNVTENNSTSQRVGTIKLTYGSYAMGEFTVTQSGRPVVSLTLNKSELALLTGASETLIVTVDPTNADLQWSSNNTSVATVDQNGKVTATGNGTATISVMAGEKTAKCTVTVTTAVKGVSLNKTSLKLSPGESEALQATISPSTASNQSVTWTSGNTSSATVDQSGKVTAVARGTALITVKTVDGGFTATCSISVAPAGTVDLNLPSGLLWASCNLGASKPEAYGYYYAWGETTTKYNYSWSTYKWCNGSSNTLTKYCTQSSYGKVDNIKELQCGEKSGETVDDVARAKLGGKWRMPRIADFSELKKNTNNSWTTYNGVKGWKFTSKTNSANWIFLPAAGFRDGATLNNAGSDGYYWTTSLATYSFEADYMHFDSSLIFSSYYGNRCTGKPVRPVTE